VSVLPYGNVTPPLPLIFFPCSSLTLFFSPPRSPPPYPPPPPPPFYLSFSPPFPDPLLRLYPMISGPIAPFILTPPPPLANSGLPYPRFSFFIFFLLCQLYVYFFLLDPSPVCPFPPTFSPPTPDLFPPPPSFSLTVPPPPPLCFFFFFVHAGPFYPFSSNFSCYCG